MFLMFSKEQRSKIIDQTYKFKEQLLEEIKFLREEVKNCFIKTLLLLKRSNHDEGFCSYKNRLIKNSEQHPKDSYRNSMNNNTDKKNNQFY